MIRGFRRRRRVRRKQEAELAFWRGRQKDEGGTLGLPLDGQAVFCDRFGLTPDFYEGKRVLDVGCGPRGSLEWADMVAERVGLDPLAERYRELGTDRHQMRYVAGGAEAMPFPDGSFDVVSTMNSLDHVDDVDLAVSEITRVTASGGTWLMVVEADAAPSPTEPQTIPWDFVQNLTGWQVNDQRAVALGADHDIYAALKRDDRWSAGPGLIVARLTRSAVGPAR